jgi:type I restriction enzyme S subunit
MMIEMKPSGIEGFFDIPGNWEITKMAYVFSFGKGLNITKEDLQDEGIPAISYGDIHSRYGFEFDPSKHELKCVAPKYMRSSPNSLLHYGDFVFADTSEDIAGSGNFTHLSSQEATFASYHTIIARPKRPLDYRYVAYLFDSEPFRTQIRHSVSGVKVFSITQLILKNVKLLIPPLTEQRVISAFLDDRCGYINGIVTDLERQVEILRQYKKALITETVTKGLNKSVQMQDSGIEWIGEMPSHWEIKRLKYCLEEQLQYGANESGDIFEEGLPRYIRITDIDSDNTLKEDGKLSLSFNIAKPYLLQDGDVLFARSGATVGKSFYYDEKYGIAAFAGYLIKARANRQILLPRYLYFVTLGSGYEIWKDQVFSQATIQNIGADKYALLPMTIPPKTEQARIAAYLDSKCAEVDTLIAEKQRSAEIMRQYKRSLIYEYVTGKKRVTS